LGRCSNLCDRNYHYCLIHHWILADPQRTNVAYKNQKELELCNRREQAERISSWRVREPQAGSLLIAYLQSIATTCLLGNCDCSSFRARRRTQRICPSRPGLYSSSASRAGIYSGLRQITRNASSSWYRDCLQRRCW